jgi:lactoylglutathione lyase
MKIEHIALWTHQLEAQKAFYTTYFGGTPGEYSENPAFGFAAYFITFTDGARLEIMQMPGIPANANNVDKQAVGWIHVAFSVGSREKVDSLTDQLRVAGYRVFEEPHESDDGYYASFILDPDSNIVEITV